MIVIIATLLIPRLAALPKCHDSTKASRTDSSERPLRVSDTANALSKREFPENAVSRYGRGRRWRTASCINLVDAPVATDPP
ncbi:hypothetical protein EVAR_87902_1 [Eumeta japonica]|uniref:Secreted protein n=1 Tax=Eumeta variegata TaxID=151549 RepID=A0A4C1WXC3_EUMVA|nr:hypothetical protein EVAR_87902_1 [Eumeta japonica]